MAAGAEEVESSSSDEEEENTGIPWMIDGAWVDQRAPAPLRTVAALGAVPDGEHAAHVRLADGSTLTRTPLLVNKSRSLLPGRRR